MKLILAAGTLCILLIQVTATAAVGMEHASGARRRIKKQSSKSSKGDQSNGKHSSGKHSKTESMAHMHNGSMMNNHHHGMGHHPHHLSPSTSSSSSSSSSASKGGKKSHQMMTTNLPPDDFWDIWNSPADEEYNGSYQPTAFISMSPTHSPMTHSSVQAAKHSKHDGKSHKMQKSSAKSPKSMAKSTKHSKKHDHHGKKDDTFSPTAVPSLVPSFSGTPSFLLDGDGRSSSDPPSGTPSFPIGRPSTSTTPSLIPSVVSFGEQASQNPDKTVSPSSSEEPSSSTSMTPTSSNPGGSLSPENSMDMDISGSNLPLDNNDSTNVARPFPVEEVDWETKDGKEESSDNKNAAADDETKASTRSHDSSKLLLILALVYMMLALALMVFLFIKLRSICASRYPEETMIVFEGDAATTVKDEDSDTSEMGEWSGLYSEGHHTDRLQEINLHDTTTTGESGADASWSMWDEQDRQLLRDLLAFLRGQRRVREG